MGPVGPLLLINGPRAVIMYHVPKSLPAILYIGPRMGHVIVCLAGCILGKIPRKKETLSDFC